VNIDYALKDLISRYPVPADCPAYLRAIGRKESKIWNDTAYIGKPEWCSRCVLKDNYCDTQICVSNLSPTHKGGTG